MSSEDWPDRVDVGRGVRLYCENCGADLGEILGNHGPVCHAVFCTNCGWKPECE